MGGWRNILLLYLLRLSFVLPWALTEGRKKDAHEVARGLRSVVRYFPVQGPRKSERQRFHPAHLQYSLERP